VLPNDQLPSKRVSQGRLAEAVVPGAGRLDLVDDLIRDTKRGAFRWQFRTAQYAARFFHIAGGGFVLGRRSRGIKVEPKEVEVTVEGDARRVEALQRKEIRALVDLSGIEAARELVKRIEISTPAGITLVRVAPQEVKIIIPPRS